MTDLCIIREHQGTVSSIDPRTQEVPKESAIFSNSIYMCYIPDIHSVVFSDVDTHLIRCIGTNGIVSTLAGSSKGLLDGPKLACKFNAPKGITRGTQGSIFVADCWNHRIRLIQNDDSVVTYAGTDAGYLDGKREIAKFCKPSNLLRSPIGTLFISDSGNNMIRFISNEGIVTTFAGSVCGYQEGPALQARFNNPAGLALTSHGDLLVCDSYNNRIRLVSPGGIVSTYGQNENLETGLKLGQVSQCLLNSSGDLIILDHEKEPKIITHDGKLHLFFGNLQKKQTSSLKLAVPGPNLSGQISVVSNPMKSPDSICAMPADKILIGDVSYQSIHQLDLNTGIITKYAGIGEAIDMLEITSLRESPDNIIFAVNKHFHRIYIIDEHDHFVLYAGSKRGHYDGERKKCSMNLPRDLCFVGGDSAGRGYEILVTDSGNQVIRKIDADGNMTTFAGQVGIEGQKDAHRYEALFTTPSLICYSNGSTFICQENHGSIRRIDHDGFVTTIKSNFGDLTSSLTVEEPIFGDIISGLNGELYVSAQHLILMMTSNADSPNSFTFKKLAGSTLGFVDGPIERAKFSDINHLAILPDGNILVCDENNNVIRLLDISKNQVSTLAGCCLPGCQNGDSESASFNCPHAICVNRRHEIFVMDSTVRRLRFTAI